MDTNALVLYSDKQNNSELTNIQQSCPYCHRSLPIPLFAHFRLLHRSHLASSLNEGYFEKFFVQSTLLGRGGKGVVYKVHHVLDGIEVGIFAVKKIAVGDDHTNLQKVLEEVDLLSHVQSPFILSYNHAWLENSRLSDFGPKIPVLHILQEYCEGGDLQNLIDTLCRPEHDVEQIKIQRRHSKGTDGSRPQTNYLISSRIIAYTLQIAAGLQHLHSMNIIHRDLKPSNCLLTKRGSEGYTVVLADFGEAQKVESIAIPGGTCTLEYTAPETIGNSQLYTKQSDLYCFGLILHFLCFNCLPYKFSDDEPQLLKDEILNWRGYSTTYLTRKNLPIEIHALLSSTLHPQPSFRPSLNEICSVLKSLDVVDYEMDERLSLSYNKSVATTQSPSRPRTPAGLNIGTQASREVADSTNVQTHYSKNYPKLWQKRISYSDDNAVKSSQTELLDDKNRAVQTLNQSQGKAFIRKLFSQHKAKICLLVLIVIWDQSKVPVALFTLLILVILELLLT